MSDWVDANRPTVLSSAEGIPDNHVVTIRERRITVDFPTLIQNNIKTDTVTLDLDSEWDEISPVIIFTSKGYSVSVMYTGDPVFVPSDITIDTGSVDLSVMGYDSTGAVRLVTVEAPGVFNVIQSGAFTGETAEEPSPDLLGQVVSAANDAANAAKSANDAATKATNATTSASEATESANTAATKANAAADRANTAAIGAENVLDSFSANILHREVGPEPVLRVEDAYSARPIKMAVHGKTVQNLWVNPSGTLGGVTVTSNDDGSVTIAGESQGVNYVGYKRIFNIKPSTKYMLSCDGPTPTGCAFRIDTLDVSGDAIHYNIAAITPSYSSPVAFTTESNAASIYVYLYTADGSTASGTYRVMLNEGETAEPWCPPGIHSVGETIGSKPNMIKSFGGSSNGITATENADGTLSLAGEPETNAMFQIGTVSPLESGKQYTISIDTPIAHEYVSGSSGACLYLNVPSSDGGYGTDHIFAFGETLSTTFTVPSNVTLTTLRISCIAHQDVTGTYKVMLNEGGTPEPWAPPGKCPTSVDIVTAGKNLWKNPLGTNNGLTFNEDENGVVSISGTVPDGKTAAIGRSFVGVGALRGKMITVSCNKTLDAGEVYFQGYDKHKSQIFSRVIGAKGGKTSDTVVVSENIDYFWFAFANFCQGSYNVTDFKIQLELGSEATEYEPPTVTTNTIDLQGSKLYSLPDGTTDKLIIGADGLCNKSENVSKMVYDGSSDEYWMLSTEKEYTQVFMIRHDFEHKLTDINSMCNMLSNNSGIDLPCYTGDTDFVYVALPKTVCGTVEQLRAFLASSNLVILANSKSTNETDLGTIDLPKLPSPNATTYATSDVSPDVSMDYSRDINIAFNNLEDLVNTLLGGA